MNRLRQFRLFLLAGVIAAGCSSVFEPGSKQSELDANRQKWATRGFRDYTFTHSMVCFCPVENPMTLTVLNDSVVSAKVQRTGAELNPRWLKTINGLFDFIDRAIDEHAAVLEVEYDPSLGYPTRIIYDGSKNVADDEVTYTVSDLRAITGARAGVRVSANP
jgi:hypothetical protein